ncbi:Sister chromatid cohesion 1 protein [Actinidia chinensis var. chinensis]|uniref:Sister chromatid cohesion 1 protein n=1 Tax=Actinidia chinensis var. chinensis TaxID=1590841 RepID=A0A2R6RR57_ACTCC|nr:Sister chromatid cohesion 1 protein [Actinidia chinensis var. chinensis]
MFYSHQILARKAPLGQICEEILNPSVPMALRLSGILMGNLCKIHLNFSFQALFSTDLRITFALFGLSSGGVVIVYERKVKLLYDDVTRLQRLDNVEEPFINTNPREEDQSEQYHQDLFVISSANPYSSLSADVANITLFERFDSYQTNTDAYNRFERFDIEGDDETQFNVTSHERTQILSTLIPSPPHQVDPQMADEILDQHPVDQVNQQSDEGKAVSQPQQDHKKQGPPRRKARKPVAFAMDYEQTIIPGLIYQSWLQSTSDIVSRRGRKRKVCPFYAPRFNTMPTMKIKDLMDLPPTVLVCGLFATGNGEIHYPAPLLELWMRSTQPPHDSPSGRISGPQPPEPSSSSPADRVHHNDPVGLPFEDFHSGLGSQSLGVSIEKLRKNLNVNELPNEFLMEELRSNLVNNGVREAEANVMVTPGNSGEVNSIPSSGSGHGFPSHSSEINSGRSNKKRPHSSSRHSGSGLEPVAEETSWQHPDPNFKLSRLSENGLTPENDLLVETGPTQTQPPILNPPIDHITDSIRMHLKTHFDTPGSSQTESLNQLALGMNKSRAANLFYQTCVLASRDFIRVEQRVAYGDILISRGAKM